MNLSKRTKLLVAAAALVAAAGTTGAAFTGAGLVNNDPGGTSTWVGGTVSQSYTGATLQNIAYNYVDSSHTEISGVTLTFAEDVSTHTVQVSFNGSSTEIACSEAQGDSTGTIYSCNPGGNVTLSSIAVTVI